MPDLPISDRKVAVLGTGGTISSLGRDNLDLIDYPESGKKLEVDELLARWPEIGRHAQLLPVRFRAIGSTDIGPADWLDMVHIIHGLAREHADLAGLVVTHGTATTEETAYFLNLALKTAFPVVVVGAQRPSSALSTDATRNLINAVRVAASDEARGLGALVLLNDEIQAAREVTKTSTLRMQTFRTPDFGVLGHADGDRIAIYRRPVRRGSPDAEFDVEGLSALPRVDVSYAYAGCDGTAVEAFVAAGAKGIVSAGMAPGSSTKAERAALVAAREKGVVVVQSTRAGSGRVAYSEGLRNRGFVSADNLTPQKARILLMLALTRTTDADEIQRMFEVY